MKIQYSGPEAGGVILGIDPGLGSDSTSPGALAFYSEGPLDTPEFFTIFDLPVIGKKKQRAIDDAALADIIAPFKPTMAFIEKVHGMPAWGRGSLWRFAQSFGTVLGVLGALKIPKRGIRPQDWKKHYGLKGGDKEAARRMAMQRWPAHQTLFARVKDHNRAEAALIAAYGKKVLA